MDSKLKFKRLSIEQIIPGGNCYNEFQPGIPKDISLFTDCIRYKENEAFFLKDIVNNKIIWTLSLIDINNCLKKRIKRLPEINFLNTDPNICWFSFNNRIYFYNCFPKLIFNQIKIKNHLNYFDF